MQFGQSDGRDIPWGDWKFESIFLQRRIGNEPVRPRLAEDRLSGPRGSPLKGYISISYEDLAAFWRLSRGYDFAGKLKSVAFR